MPPKNPKAASFSGTAFGFFAFHARTISSLRQLLFSIFLIFYSINCLSVFGESEKNLQTVYVTGDALNVRIRPDRQSEKLGFLPYGTKILVEKAQTFEVQNRSKIYWFYFPEMQGYIFGDYLSDSPPPKGKKKASLYLYSGDNCGYYQNETLTLQDGIARLEIDWEEEGGFCSKGLLEGIVSFRNGRMSISQWKGDRLKDHCSSASETDPKLTEDDLKKRLMFYAGIEEDLELYYDPLLDGYATEKIIQMYKSGKWKIDKKSCSIRQDYECKYSDKNTTQSLGYFCFRNSRT